MECLARSAGKTVFFISLGDTVADEVEYWHKLQMAKVFFRFKGPSEKINKIICKPVS
jgi:hypothetical protein